MRNECEEDIMGVRGSWQAREGFDKNATGLNVETARGDGTATEAKPNSGDYNERVATPEGHRKDLSVVPHHHTPRPPPYKSATTFWPSSKARGLYSRPSTIATVLVLTKNGNKLSSPTYHLNLREIPALEQR